MRSPWMSGWRSRRHCSRAQAWDAKGMRAARAKPKAAVARRVMVGLPPGSSGVEKSCGRRIFAVRAVRTQEAKVRRGRTTAAQLLTTGKDSERLRTGLGLSLRKLESEGGRGGSRCDRGLRTGRGEGRLIARAAPRANFLRPSLYSFPRL